MQCRRRDSTPESGGATGGNGRRGPESPKQSERPESGGPPGGISESLSIFRCRRDCRVTQAGGRVRCAPSSSSSTPMSTLAAGAASSTVRNPGSGKTEAAGPTASSVHDHVTVTASSSMSPQPAVPLRRRLRGRTGERPRGPGARPPVRREVPPPRAAAGRAAAPAGPESCGRAPTVRFTPAAAGRSRRASARPRHRGSPSGTVARCRSRRDARGSTSR